MIQILVAYLSTCKGRRDLVHRNGTLLSLTVWNISLHACVALVSKIVVGSRSQTFYSSSTLFIPFYISILMSPSPFARLCIPYEFPKKQCSWYRYSNADTFSIKAIKRGLPRYPSYPVEYIIIKTQFYFKCLAKNRHKS